jgi:serine/threonine-protein kinase
VYDYGEDNGQPFIVMRYMSGGTLAERLASGRIPLREVVPIVQRLAEALDEAHSRNIVHRDIKPGNIMFDSKGQAFLSDFGIAKLLETNSLLTGTGIVGTPAYMSPEQAAGRTTLDGRSDVYSLGIIVYEMLSGRHPYEADTPMSMLYKQVNEAPPPLDTARLGLPAVSRRILARALAKKPEERYPSAGDLAKFLSGLHSAPVSVVPGKPPEPPPPLPLPPTSPAGIAPDKENPETLLTRTRQRLSPSLLGLVSLPIVGALICVAAVIVLNPIGNPATPTPSPTLTSRPTLTTAPPSHTPEPTRTTQKPTAIPTTALTTDTATPTSPPTLTPSATFALAPTARPTSTRIPATNTSAPPPANTSAPAPTNTLVPPTTTSAPPPTHTSGPPPTNTPVPEQPTNTPAP